MILTQHGMNSLLREATGCIYSTDFKQIAAHQFEATIGQDSEICTPYTGQSTLEIATGVIVPCGVFATTNAPSSETSWPCIGNIPFPQDSYAISLEWFHGVVNSPNVSWMAETVLRAVASIDSNRRQNVGFGWVTNIPMTLYNNFYINSYAFVTRDDIKTPQVLHIAMTARYDNGSIYMKQYVNGELAVEGHYAVNRPTMFDIRISGNGGYNFQIKIAKLSIWQGDRSINDGMNYPVPTAP